MLLRIVLGGYFLGGLALVLGCANADQMPTAPVRGRITSDGQPVPQGTITFTPAQGRGATGNIQPDGSYELSTYRAGDGAVLGTHQVTIIARRPLDPADLVEGGYVDLVAPRYADPDASGLKAKVVADSNVFDFDLAR